MTFAQKGQLKKQYMPQSYRNFYNGMLIALICVIVIGVAACVALGILFGEDESSPIFMIALAAWVIIMLALLIVYAAVLSSYQKKIMQQRTNELLYELNDMPLEAAEAELAARRIVTVDGFVADRGPYAGTLVVPYNTAVVSVYSANIYTKIVTVIAVRDMYGTVQAEHILDRAIYNFILKKGLRIDFQGHTNLIVSQKDLFVKKYFGRDSDKMAMTFLFGAIGAIISDESKNINSSRRVVLNVLSREMEKCQ